MKAYLINGTEFYAAESASQAAALHAEQTQEDEMTIEHADLGAPWNDEESATGPATLGDALAKATKPTWMGSTEI